MGFIRYNENPYKNETSDCVIRAVATFLGISWDDAYIDLMVQGFLMKDMPHKNYIWDRYLINKGYRRYLIPDTYPEYITVRDFAHKHPNGRYLLGTGTHVIALVDGDYYDTWDSGEEIPVYYYKQITNQ